MLIARVLGPVVATAKAAYFHGRTLLAVKEVLAGGGLAERTLVALDGVQSGAGDLVLVAKNGGAVDDVTGVKDSPANLVIVARVDRVEPPWA